MIPRHRSMVVAALLLIGVLAALAALYPTDSAFSTTADATGSSFTAGTWGGALFTTGDDAYGQTAAGGSTPTTRTTFAQSASGTTWSEVDAGASHACGVQSDGTAWCWGRNNNGQIGNGTGVDQRSPVQVTTPANATPTGWESVSAGGAASCGVQTNGRLFCWGRDASGQLGNNSLTSTDAPVEVNGARTDWKAVGTGDSHTCALRTDGTLWCWGRDLEGELGDGGTTNLKVPTQVNGARTDWAFLGIGDFHSCAGRTDGSLWCWGKDDRSQLGDGGTANQLIPVREGQGFSDWTAVSAGTGHTCGLRATGTLGGRTLWCWGQGQNGRLGTNSTADSTTPAQENGASTLWASLGVGDNHSCATRTDGSLWCWGTAGSTRYGATPSNTNVPNRIGTSNGWKSVSGGAAFTAGINVP